MARYLRAFTLDESTIAAVDKAASLAHTDARLRILFPPAIKDAFKAPELDEYNLALRDYQELYAAFIPPLKGHRYPDGKVRFNRDDLQEPTHKCLTRLAARDQTKYPLVMAEVRRRQKLNRTNTARIAKLATTQPTINVSRIVEALVTLGLEAWKERAASLDLEGSTGTDAGESQDELPQYAGRDTVAVPAL